MECRHVNAIARGNDPIGRLYCPSCDKTFFVSTIINLRLEELRTFLHTLSLYPRPRQIPSPEELQLQRISIVYDKDSKEYSISLCRTDGAVRTQKIGRVDFRRGDTLNITFGGL